MDLQVITLLKLRIYIPKLLQSNHIIYLIEKYALSLKQKKIMKDIVKIDTIAAYNSLRGVETLHPLVSVIEMSKTKPIQGMRTLFGFYCVFLKEVKCGDLMYGRNTYDYQEGTLVFLAPGQILGVNTKEVIQPKGWALLFHPDLIKGTSLGRNIKNYTFFRTK